MQLSNLIAPPAVRYPAKAKTARVEAPATAAALMTAAKKIAAWIEAGAIAAAPEGRSAATAKAGTPAMSDAETKRVAERTMGAAAVMRVAARVAVAAPTARAAGAKRRRGTKGHPLHGAAGWSTSWRCSPLRDGPSARASNPRCGAHGVDPRPCSRRDGAGNRLRQAAGGPTSAAPLWPALRDLPERPAIDLEFSCDGGDGLSPPSLRLRLRLRD